MNREADPPLREQTVNQMGADIAVQLMLMMLFACMSQFANQPETLQTQLRDQLLDICKNVKLPPESEHVEQEVRSAARTVISNVFVGVKAIQFAREEA
jgi:hypothetical protein